MNIFALPGINQKTEKWAANLLQEFAAEDRKMTVQHYGHWDGGSDQCLNFLGEVERLQGSDIDLLLHFRGNDRQRQELLLWLDGWSQSLADRNYLRTGYRVDRLLDIHLITDEDIAERTSWAAKIGATTDAARQIPLGDQPDKSK